MVDTLTDVRAPGLVPFHLPLALSGSQSSYQEPQTLAPIFCIDSELLLMSKGYSDNMRGTRCDQAGGGSLVCGNGLLALGSNVCLPALKGPSPRAIDLMRGPAQEWGDRLVAVITELYKDLLSDSLAAEEIEAVLSSIVMKVNNILEVVVAMDDNLGQLDEDEVVVDDCQQWLKDLQSFCWALQKQLQFHCKNCLWGQAYSLFSTAGLILRHAVTLWKCPVANVAMSVDMQSDTNSEQSTETLDGKRRAKVLTHVSYMPYRNYWAKKVAI